MTLNSAAPWRAAEFFGGEWGATWFSRGDLGLNRLSPPPGIPSLFAFAISRSFLEHYVYERFSDGAPRINPGLQSSGSLALAAPPVGELFRSGQTMMPESPLAGRSKSNTSGRWSDNCTSGIQNLFGLISGLCSTKSR